jgi:hypothetical protein
VLWETALQRFVPAAALSRVSSYDILGSLLLGPVGLLLAGPWSSPSAPGTACSSVPASWSSRRPVPCCRGTYGALNGPLTRR